MKYSRLDQTMVKYWNSLQGKTGNHANVLVAFEVTHQLPVVPIVARMDFDSVWSNENENAKDVIREIYKEVVGFDHHYVLELTRRLFQFRCHGSRSSVSPFYWRLFNITKEIVPKEDYLDDGELAEAFNLAERTLTIKRSSISGYSGVKGTMDLQYIQNDCITELDNLMNESARDKTSTVINRQFNYAKNIISAYIDLIVLSNTFDFNSFHPVLVETYISTAVEAILSEGFNQEVMVKAVQELVE